MLDPTCLTLGGEKGYRTAWFGLGADLVLESADAMFCWRLFDPLISPVRLESVSSTKVSLRSGCGDFLATSSKRNLNSI